MVKKVVVAAVVGYNLKVWPKSVIVRPDMDSTIFHTVVYVLPYTYTSILAWIYADYLHNRA